MFDSLKETLSILSTNKLRTALTGLSVTWGIFILVVLLAFGNGFNHVVSRNFNNGSFLALSVWPGYTSKPYKGMSAGRMITVTEKDVNKLKDALPENSFVSVRARHNGNGFTLSAGSKSIATSIIAYGEEANGAVENKIIAGRNLNRFDYLFARKMTVLSRNAANSLFDGDAVGKYVQVGRSTTFKVVGVYDREGDINSEASILIPFTTDKVIFNPEGNIGEVIIGAPAYPTAAQCKEYEEQVRKVFSDYFLFDPTDESAVWTYSRVETYRQNERVMGGINLFLWIIGLSTLVAGVVGISNIMLISVHERIKEIGIRRALGATPRNIVSSIIIESLTITVPFGMLGIVAGTGVSRVLCIFFPEEGGEDRFQILSNPSVDMHTAMAALAVIIIAAIIAGYVPARKAARVKPIEAMNAK